MENASKALIIAGAILLSILIIGLGMFIYQQAAGAMSGANLDPQKAQAFNEQFVKYQGTQQGANARALYSLIASNNRTHTDDPSQQIQMTINDTYLTATPDEITDTEEPADTAVTLPANTLKAGKTYYVRFSYSKSGYITRCTIDPMK